MIETKAVPLTDEERAEREKVAGLHDIKMATQAAFDAACKSVPDAMEALNQSAKALRDELQRQIEAHHAVAYEAAGIGPEYRAALAAIETLQAHPLAARLLTNWPDEDVTRCAISGVPLLDTDETVCDRATDETVLRCLVLPPRTVDDTDKIEAEEAA
jgi:hypothetical protein